MALELGVKGLMNAQIAVKGDEFYIIKRNPRLAYGTLCLKSDRCAHGENRNPNRDESNFGRA